VKVIIMPAMAYSGEYECSGLQYSKPDGRCVT